MSEPDQRFPAECRLRRQLDFERAYRRRASASDSLLLIFVCPNDLSQTRLGLSVSKKVGKAHARNRWKRRLRETFRLHRHELPPGLDLVVIPRGAAEPPFEQLAESLVRVTARAARRLDRPSPKADTP